MGEKGDENSEKDAKENIAYVVYAEVKSSPGVEYCPRNETEGYAFVSIKESEEGGDGEGVGGVGGEESVCASSITTHDVEGVHDVWVLRWAIARDEGFEDGGRYLVGDDNEENGEEEEGEKSLEIVLTKEDVEEREHE